MSKHAPVSLLAFVLVSASCLSSNPQTPAPATPPPALASAVAPTPAAPVVAPTPPVTLAGPAGAPLINAPAPLVPPPPAQPPPPAPPAAPVLSPEVQEGGRVPFRLQPPKAGEAPFTADWLPNATPKLTQGARS